MVVLKVIFLLSKNLIDPSVVKVSPYYFLYGKYLFFCVVLFYFYIYFATERRFMELKQNICLHKSIKGIWNQNRKSNC